MTSRRLTQCTTTGLDPSALPTPPLFSPAGAGATTSTSPWNGQADAKGLINFDREGEGGAPASASKRLPARWGCATKATQTRRNLHQRPRNILARSCNQTKNASVCCGKTRRQRRRSLSVLFPIYTHVLFRAFYPRYYSRNAPLVRALPLGRRPETQAGISPIGCTHHPRRYRLGLLSAPFFPTFFLAFYNGESATTVRNLVPKLLYRSHRLESRVVFSSTSLNIFSFSASDPSNPA
ncbi:hypothetical protein DFH09DRAFT_380064 [Mycena vulgaris]|nr:hypothetical protein DFH09DRAFT_380064 [Mycena vulgaris]